jgi:hypothetical protein
MPGRIVAVGDVHGAYEEFVTILQRSGLIDANRQWIGGSSVLVQTGDLLDRGAESRQCLDLLMELQRQAEKQNGRVIALLGNHEVMTLRGDLRYVSPADYRGFATDQSEKVREQAYEDYRKFLSARRNRQSNELLLDEARQKWMAEHPLGYFERRDAFSPQGVYGRWLRQRDAVIQLGDVIFVHGGLNPTLRFHNIDELNDRVHSDIASFDSLWQSLSEKKIIWRYMKLEEAMRQVQEEWAAIQARGQVEDPGAVQAMQKLMGVQTWFSVSPDSPVWYRGLALEPEEKLRKHLNSMLARLKAQYLVAGHTVRPKFDITPRFDNHVFLIDTGMLKESYGGRASALEIQNGGFTAYYSDEKPQILRAPDTGGSPGTAEHKP